MTSLEQQFELKFELKLLRAAMPAQICQFGSDSLESGGSAPCPVPRPIIASVSPFPLYRATVPSVNIWAACRHSEEPGPLVRVGLPFPLSVSPDQAAGEPHSCDDSDIVSFRYAGVTFSANAAVASWIVAS